MHKFVRLGVVTAVYLLVAGAGLSVSSLYGTVSPVWPASGVAIAALALWGLRMWPAVSAGAFLTNYLVAQLPVAVAAGIACGNTLEALLGAAILLRFQTAGEVSRIRDAIVMIGAALIAPAPSAVGGVLSLGLGGFLPWNLVFDVGAVWWVGDLMGVLVAMPLLLAWFGSSASADYVARPAEFAGTVLVAAGLMAIAYSSDVSARLDLLLPLVSASLFLPLLWAILRLRPREALVVLTAGCGVAIVFTVARFGRGSIEPLLGLQVITFAVSAGTLVLLGAITDRIRTQIAMRDSQECLSRTADRLSETLAQFSYAMKAGHSGTFYWTETTDTVWSDEMLALYGLRREGFDGRRDAWLTTLVPEFRDAGIAAVEHAFKTGEFNLDFQIRRRDTGEIRWLAGRAKVDFDEAGQPVRMVGMSTDITDRKLTELRLQASEAQLSAIFENAPIGIAYLALPDRRFLRLNERLCAMTGYERGELLEMRDFDLTFPDDRGIGGKEYEALMACTRKSFDIEKRYVRKDGSTIWARTSVAALCNESRTAATAIALIEDVTEAKLADAARRDAERRLQLAVDMAELGSWEFEVATDRLTVDPSWMRRLGLGEHELDTGERLRSRVHPDDLERARRHFQDYLGRPEGQYRIEFRFRFGDGSYRWISSRAIAVTDGAGRLVKLAGTYLDITERKRAEQRIREESLHDPLTGLPNRALLIEYGSHLLSAAYRNRGRCAVLFIDLDRFKPINDLYGHEAGDAVLIEVGRRLRRCTRQQDLVGRLGGDEFLILLPHVDAEYERVDTVAQHVLDVVARPILLDEGKLSVSVSPSIGISRYPEQGGDVDTLIQKADMAMYQAKRQGCATYQAYTPDLERRADATLARKSELQSALQRGNLVLHYQPIIGLRTGRMVAAEALLRMVQNDGEIVGPSGFLPKAESSELGAELDQWVLTSACRQHERWVREGLAPILLSVNVSPRQFMLPGFAEKVQRIVTEAGIDPTQLQIEVSGKVVEGAAALAVFRQLKSIGVKIALDGFGTAPFDLDLLSNLPIDCIKMEPKLVRGMPTGTGGEAVSKLVIALGKLLKLEIVGEGIESEEVLRSVQASGCDDAQGFYLSRPLPPEDFASWYRAHQVH